MKTKVILLKDVPGYGKKGSVVEVATGFARNMLVPKGMAQTATDAVISNLSFNIEQADKKTAKARIKAEEVKTKIESKPVTISAKTGPSGTLFGAVTTEMISRALKREFNIVVDKKSIDVSEPIKSIGTHKIILKLHHDVEAIMRIEVVSQSK